MIRSFQFRAVALKRYAAGDGTARLFVPTVPTITIKDALTP